MCTAVTYVPEGDLKIKVEFGQVILFMLLLHS